MILEPGVLLIVGTSSDLVEKFRDARIVRKEFSGALRLKNGSIQISHLSEYRYARTRQIETLAALPFCGVQFFQCVGKGTEP